MWRDLITRYIPLIFLALLPFIYGLWRVDQALTFYGPAAGYIWGRPWFFLSALIFIPVVSQILRRIRGSHRLILVHKNGLQIKWNPQKTQVIYWQDLSGISTQKLQETFLGIPLGYSFKAVVHPNIGSPLKLDPRIPDLEDLCFRIKGKIYPQLLSQLRDQQFEGKNLYFGPITLSPDFISIKGEAFPWAEVSKMDVRKGTLVVELVDGRPKKFPVKEIPNIGILLQLIQEGIVE